MGSLLDVLVVWLVVDCDTCGVSGWDSVIDWRSANLPKFAMQIWQKSEINLATTSLVSCLLDLANYSLVSVLSADDVVGGCSETNGALSAGTETHNIFYLSMMLIRMLLTC